MRSGNLSGLLSGLAAGLIAGTVNGLMPATPLPPTTPTSGDGVASVGGQAGVIPGASGGQFSVTYSNAGGQAGITPGASGGTAIASVTVSGGQTGVVPGADGGVSTASALVSGGQAGIIPGADGGASNTLISVADTGGQAGVVPGADGGEYSVSYSNTGGQAGVVPGADGGVSTAAVTVAGGQAGVVPGANGGTAIASVTVSGGQAGITPGASGGTAIASVTVSGGQAGIIPGANGGVAATTLTALSFTVSQSSSSPAGSQSSLTDYTTTTGAGTASNTPSYIQIDLGANYTISKAIVAGGSITTFGSTATSLNASSIKSSTDNSSFTSQASITGMSDTATSSALYQSFSVGNTSARYWRIERSSGVLGTSHFQLVGTQSFSYPTTFTYSSGGDTNGLLYALGYSTFGTSYYDWANPAVIGTITVTSSVAPASSTNLYNLSDRNNNTNCSTGSGASQTITIDLGSGRSFRCNSYTLRSSSNGNQYPRNWKIRGSNDNSTYTDIDVRTGDTTVLASVTWYSFNCNQGNTNSYRYIQFQITGTNSGGFNTIDLSEWEFYGVLT